MKAWITLAISVFLAAAIVERAIWVFSTSSTVEKDNSTVRKENNNSLEFRKLKFNTFGATEESYKKFIEDLRNLLRSEHDQRSGIAVLLDPSIIVDPNDRFIHVELENAAGEIVTIGIDVVNVYVVGYLARNQAYFFSDTIDLAWQKLFPDAAGHNPLSFNSNYGGLERAAHQERGNIELGATELDQAISSLYHTDVGEALTNQARGVIIAVQMVAEAARFRYIEGRVRASIRNQQCFRPDMSMLSLENHWDPLSEGVQQSAWPVQLQRPDGTRFDVDGVTANLIAILALMIFKCRAPPPGPKTQQQNAYYPSWSSFMWNPLASWTFPPPEPQEIRSYNESAQCVDEERTVRIVGRDGLCVDVSKWRYENGNPIILWPCKSQDEGNQLWTFKKDGTIQSRGKCLTTYGYSPGCYMMIYDCPTPVSDATRWELREDGTFINPRSRLVLTSSGSKGTTLTVENNIDASRQGWLASNNWNPFATTITGLNGLCLDTDENGVWIENCQRGKGSQQWAMYIDGSIRPQQNTQNCITSDGLFQNSKVVIQSCSAASSSQRWMFKNDGTLFNLDSGLAMDVKKSDPSLKEIILWKPTGSPNQLWLPMF